jgi:arsenate reductase
MVSDVFEAYSAGTETKPQINQDAVAVIKELYGIDMNETQRSKLLADIPAVDVVITMGCNVSCPYLPCKHRKDWGLDDPTGKPKEEFIKTAKIIEQKVMTLKGKITDILKERLDV